MSKPDAAMMEVAEKLAQVIENGAQTLPPDLFAGSVTIIENFPPYLFADPAAWAKAMRNHLAGQSALQHRFEAVHDFSLTDDKACFALKTIWTGLTKGKPFCETGGWSLVLTKRPEGWRLLAYGWAVTDGSGG